MRWTRLAFISLLSFLFVTGSTFFKKSIALLLCGIFTLNALTCSAQIDGGERAIAAISPSATEVNADQSSGKGNAELVGEIPRRRMQNGGNNAPLPVPEPQPASNSPLPLPRLSAPEQPTSPPTNLASSGWGIDRWWATAGDRNPMPVTLTVEVYESDEYKLNVDIEYLNQWDLNDHATVTVNTGEFIQIDPFLFEDTGAVNLGRLEPGIHRLSISGFDVPQEPTVEKVTFQLKGSEESKLSFQELSALFVADYPDTYDRSYLIQVGNQSPQSLGRDDLINHFAPILNFQSSTYTEPADGSQPAETRGVPNGGERYQIPFDVTQTTWSVESRRTNPIKGDAKGYLDLSKWEKDIYSDPNIAKIYASINESKEHQELAINYFFHYPLSNWGQHAGYNTHAGDWEGVTLFLRKELNGVWVPDRMAFGQHVMFATWGGVQEVEWESLCIDQSNGRHQPKVWVGLGGHASYPHKGSTLWQLGTEKEYHEGGYRFSPGLGKVEYLPRVGNEKAPDWLLYPGTWGEPNKFNGGAPHGPVFQDLVMDAVSTSVGRGQRWLDPWGWALFTAKGSPSEVDRQCEENQPEKPKPRDGNQKKGTSYGDPHLITFDGHRYSFQTVGEFVLAKSTDGYFEVQARQSPVSRNLSLNSAVSMRVGNDRVTLYSKDFPDSSTNTPLRVNGVPTVVQGDSLTLPGGGTVHKQNDSNYLIEWDTGEQVAVNIYSRGQFQYMDVFPFVFESQANQILGLLGNANGDPNDDLRFRSGNILPTKSTYGDLNQLINNLSPVNIPLGELEKLYFDQLNKDYGNSWRVTPEESLFDYAPSQTTDSFTDKSFPDAYLTLDMLSPTAIQQASSLCQQSGVDPGLMEGCIFDVGFTGYSEFAYRAAQVSNILDVIESIIPNFENPIPEIIRRLPRIPGLPF